MFKLRCPNCSKYYKWTHLCYKDKRYPEGVHYTRECGVEIKSADK